MHAVPKTGGISQVLDLLLQAILILHTMLSLTAARLVTSLTLLSGYLILAILQTDLCIGLTVALLMAHGLLLPEVIIR